MAYVNFFRFKLQKAESRRENVAWSPFAILFAVNVTLNSSILEQLPFSYVSSCQLSFNITKIFYFGTRHSITCYSCLPLDSDHALR